MAKREADGAVGAMSESKGPLRDDRQADTPPQRGAAGLSTFPTLRRSVVQSGRPRRPRRREESMSALASA